MSPHYLDGPHEHRPDGKSIRAAQYIRMSTEHQQYSTENQGDVIREYAASRGYEIVRTYADEGKSGLRMEGRNSLKQLIEDVQNGIADYGVVLVYDISRWGRFQDADESAYYEYLCKRAGIEIHYCAEQFENDGRPTSTIIKSVKRAMAGEYSRELSTKVFKGQCKLIELGFRQGGPAGFGLRRMMVDQTGNSKGLLARGEQKSLQTDRVILVPGPVEECDTVRWMYKLFTEQGKRESEIAEMVNTRGIRTDLGRTWTAGTVLEVLTNEKYIGNNVYNRKSFKLKKKRVSNPPEMWVRSDGVFEPIITPEVFFVARGIILARNQRFSDEEMLEHLRNLLARHATLSAHLIDNAGGMASSSAYRTRFGSLLRAYQLVGHRPGRDYSYLEALRALRDMHPRMIDDIVTTLNGSGAQVRCDESTGLLLINDEYTASLALSRCRATPAGRLRWTVRIDQTLAPDITVLVRMDSANRQPADYYLLPLMDIEAPTIMMCETNGAHLDTYQFDSLDYFTRMAQRRRIEAIA